MANAPLVSELQDGGARLLEELRRSNIDIKTAFWYYPEEAEDWRLVLSSRLVDEIGPLKSYHAIQAVLRRMSPSSPIALSDIAVVGLGDARARALEELLAKFPAPLVTRVRGTVLDGIYFEDSYVYPPSPSPAPPELSTSP